MVLGLVAVALAGCGGDDPTAPAQEPSAAARDAAAIAEADDAKAERQERAELRRAAAAKRKAARAKAKRVEARDEQRGAALSQVFITAGTRDQWSVIGVTANGGAVSVHTDLAPENSAAFTGACMQLVDHEPWIGSIEVVGTDGASHASWSKGDAACQSS